MFTESARYYDAIYAAKGKDYESESKRIQSLIGRYARRPVYSLLDVACGTGGHLQFMRAGYEVVGVDLDEAMLEIARGKLPGIPLHRGDMVDFDLSRKFDVVVNLFSSIGYARTKEGLTQAISNMADHTAAGGLIIVEPWIYPEDFKPGKQHAVFVDQPELKIARMDVIEVRGTLSTVNFHYLIAEGGEIGYFAEQHEVGMFTQDEYLAAFEAAGLAVTHDPEGLIGRGLYIGRKPAG